MKTVLRNFFIGASAVAVCLGLSFVIMAWTEPGAGVTPPNGTVNSPINTGTTMQSKAGGLNIAGKVGVGTTSPAEAVDVNGRVRLTQTTAPADTANKLYNVGGDLYWNGFKLNTAPATTVGLVKQIVSLTFPDSQGPSLTTSSSSWQDLTQMTKTLTTGSSNLMIWWNIAVNCVGVANMADFRVLVDGVQYGGVIGGSYQYSHDSTSPYGIPQMTITVDSMGGNAMAPVTAGSHTVKLQWRFDNAGVQSYITVGPLGHQGGCIIDPSGANFDGSASPFMFGGGMNIMEISK